MVELGVLYSEQFASLRERDTESGLDPTPNRMFTSQYGRWLSPDPAGVKAVRLDDPQTWNMYAYARNNPTTMSDPSGLSAITVSNMWGNQLGCCEGAPDFGASLFQDMAASEYSYDEYTAVANPAQNQQSQAQVLAQQVPAQVKESIGDSVEASNSKNADDQQGGFHEEGGIWGAAISDGTTIVSPAKPGAAAKPEDKEVKMDVGKAVDPALNQKMVPQGEWHVHPKGSADRRFNQPPSDVDISHAVAPINIVVGAGNKRVYFYDLSGVINQKGMKFKDFFKEP
jgi:RHS repeat-associated protein